MAIWKGEIRKANSLLILKTLDPKHENRFLISFLQRGNSNLMEMVTKGEGFSVLLCCWLWLLQGLESERGSSCFLWVVWKLDVRRPSLCKREIF